jgi:hypothetical protein
MRWRRPVEVAGWSALFFLVLPFVVKRLGGTFADGVLMGTGVAIVWYTLETLDLRRETSNLRRETARQNEITIRPLVMGSIEFSEDERRWQLVARNVGNGLAIFIRIPDMPLVDPAGDSVRFTAKFAGLSHLEKGQERPVTILEPLPGEARVEPEHLSVVQSLNPRYAVETYTMRIEYQDIRGDEHWSETQMGRGGTSLLRFSPMPAEGNR